MGKLHHQPRSKASSAPIPRIRIWPIQSAMLVTSKSSGITGVRKRANRRSTETPAEINFTARVILFQLASCFLREPLCDFVALLKIRFHVTSDTDTSKTMKSNRSRARKTEVQGKEDCMEEDIGMRLVPLSLYISSFCDHRNAHRD